MVQREPTNRRPWNGEWLDFPGNRRFLLVHNLHTPPEFTSVQMYIAFSSNPFPGDGDAGDVAPATGDVAVVEKMNSDELQIYNDTCSEQYIYVRIKADLAAARCRDCRDVAAGVLPLQ